MHSQKTLSSNKEIGRLYNKIFDTYDTHEIQRFEGNNGRDSIIVLLTNLTSQNMSELNAKNLIDKAHKWEPSMDLKMTQNNSGLEMLIDTNNTGKEFNRAVLNTNLSAAERPLLFSLSYASKSSFGNATFLLQIVDKEDNKYWTQLLSTLLAILKKTYLSFRITF